MNLLTLSVKLFSYELSEAVDQPIELLIPKRYYHDHEKYRNKYIHTPKNRPMGVGMDLFGIRKNGTEFPVEVSLSHYNYENSMHAIAFISDITIRKKVEVEIEEER